MTWTDLSEALRHLNQPTYLYIAGTVLVLAVIFILLRRRQPRNVVAYSTADGEVRVSRAAILELVQTSCEQIRDVAKPSIRIRVKGNVSHFEVRLKLRSGGRLKSVEQTLQKHLRRALTENLGIENLGKIHIVATGFKSGKIAPTETAPIPAKPNDVSEEDLFDEEPDEARDEAKPQGTSSESTDSEAPETRKF